MNERITSCSYSFHNYFEVHVLTGDSFSKHSENLKLARLQSQLSLLGWPRWGLWWPGSHGQGADFLGISIQAALLSVRPSTAAGTIWVSPTRQCAGGQGLQTWGICGVGLAILGEEPISLCLEDGWWGRRGQRWLTEPKKLYASYSVLFIKAFVQALPPLGLPSLFSAYGNPMYSLPCIPLDRSKLLLILGLNLV